MNPQFVQIPCGKCGTTVWISPAAGVGYCPSCHAPNSIPAGGVPMAGAPMAGAPMGGAPMGGAPQPPQAYSGAVQAPIGMQGNVMAYRAPKRPPVALIMGGVVLLIVGSVGFGLMRSFIFKPKGHESAKSMGIDPKKADPDAMIEKTQTLARKWRPDAAFFGINITGMNPDGTIDLSSHNVTMDFFSPSRVQASTSSGRTDAVKKFIFNDDAVNYADVFDASNRWTDVEPTPHGCTIAKLTKLLKKAGFKSGTAQITLDPKVTMAWHAIVSTPSISKWYSLDDCEELQVKFEDD